MSRSLHAKLDRYSESMTVKYSGWVPGNKVSHKNQTVTLIGDIMSTIGRQRKGHTKYHILITGQLSLYYFDEHIFSGSRVISYGPYGWFVSMSFRDGIPTLLLDRALFSLCNISSNIEKTEDNSLFGVKLLIHHWTSNLRTMNRLRWKQPENSNMIRKKEVNTRSKQNSSDTLPKTRIRARQTRVVSGK